jgi:hypothetical protein
MYNQHFLLLLLLWKGVATIFVDYFQLLNLLRLFFGLIVAAIDVCRHVLLRDLLHLAFLVVSILAVFASSVSGHKINI